MIQFIDVTKSYDQTTVLKGINLEIQSGELVTLIGPSGCGKTTTMKMINRLAEPTSGKVLIDGKDVARLNPVELRRNVGYVIQQIGLFPHMKFKDNLAIVPKLKGMKKAQYEKRVDELLDMVGLDPDRYRDRYPAELSGGQQQRVGVIRALAAEPSIILMDEPFSALAVPSRHHHGRRQKFHRAGNPRPYDRLADRGENGPEGGPQAVPGGIPGHPQRPDQRGY